MERKIVAGDKAKGITWAAAQLARQKLWRDFVESRDEEGVSGTAEVLRTTYAVWKKRKTSNLMRHAYHYNEEIMGDVRGWEEMAHELVRKRVKG